MRASQSVSIGPVIEQAINAINDTFERERQSREIAAEFEAEFNRRMEMPEGTAPKTELERHSAKQYEQDVRFPYYKQVKQGEQGELVEQVPTFGPSIESFYPWRHRATLAADSLAGCRWTTEAEAIRDELSKLPKHPIDWTQPGVFDELREEVQEVGNRVRDILTSCVAEMKSQASKSEEGDELPFGYVPNVLPKVERAKDSAVEVPQGTSLREALTVGLSTAEMNKLAELIELEQQYWEKPDSKSNPLWQKRYDANRYQEQRAAKDKRNLAIIARQIVEPKRTECKT